MKRFAYFEVIVAFRFMRSGLAQTLLIILGVGLGGGVIIFLSAILAGLQGNVVNRTLNFQAPIVILPPDQVARPLREGPQAGIAAQVQPRSQQLRSIDQWQSVRDQVARTPGVTALTPVVSGPGFAIRGDANKAVSITGIEPETYFGVIALPEKIIAGSVELGPLDIIVGKELAADLGLETGDRVRLATAGGTGSTLTVKGIFDFGNKAVNERNVYIPLRSAQSLLDLIGGVSAIEVRVEDPFAAEKIAQTLRARTDLKIDSWIRTNEQFFTAMAAQIMTNTLIRIFVGLTVALGIASVLVVSVIQKSKEIGILRAMGTSREQVQRVFLIQGAFMGLAGAVLGSALAYSFLLLWRSVARNPDGTLMFVIEMQPSLFAIATIGSALVGVLAALAPARRAARMDPVVAIRS
ncbi:MAG: ABC transporter permease [Burkholderiales bacterium]